MAQNKKKKTHVSHRAKRSTLDVNHLQKVPFNFIQQHSNKLETNCLSTNCHPDTNCISHLEFFGNTFPNEFCHCDQATTQRFGDGCFENNLTTGHMFFAAGSKAVIIYLIIGVIVLVPVLRVFYLLGVWKERYGWKFGNNRKSVARPRITVENFLGKEGVKLRESIRQDSDTLNQTDSKVPILSDQQQSSVEKKDEKPAERIGQLKFVACNLFCRIKNK